ncbi:MAG: hypothetical protein GY904_25390 [Planctomycetaceae bacterium]|nr:hypothetical protein [Planctomycetaceae bacterium]
MNVDSASAQISKRIDQFDRFHTMQVSKRESVDSIGNELDIFVSTQSRPSDGITFTGIGDNWHELNLSDAQYVLKYILSHDIAYDTAEIPEADAAEIVTDFLALFDGDCRYFSNGMFNKNTNSWGGYGFVASATCETGIVVVSSKLIGMLWCHDED